MTFIHLLSTFFIFFSADNHRESDPAKKNDPTLQSKVIIHKVWDLPEALKEISAISYIGNGLFGCIQDELGTIFIYNTSKNSIEKTISFTAAGDFEGLAIAGKDAYALRSDGLIFEIIQFESSPTVKQYQTSLTRKQDIEGLCFDKANDRLLLAIKGNERGNTNYKGIYAFNLGSKKLATEPVFKLDLSHDVLKTSRSKGGFQPSDIAIHPVTGEIYLIEAARSSLLILQPNGVPKEMVQLGRDNFQQAEGISFSPDGQLYISSEGKRAAGSITHLSINL